MTIRDKVRKWLGFIDIEAYIAGLESANRQRHEELRTTLQSLHPVLERIERGFQDRHLNRPKPTEFVQDWEQVQMNELYNLLQTQPKEEN